MLGRAFGAYKEAAQEFGYTNHTSQSDLRTSEYVFPIIRPTAESKKARLNAGLFIYLSLLF